MLHLQIGPSGISLRARDVSRGEILRELAARTGLQVDLEGPLDESVSIEIDRLPLREALESLLADHGFVLKLEEAPSDEGFAASGRLWVYIRRPAAGPAPSDAPPGRRCGGSADPAAGLRCLGRTISTATDPGDRRRAIADLARVGGDHAATTLAAAALSDADPSVRREAIYGLTEIDSQPTALAALEQALGDPEIRVRKAAVDALTDIGDDGASWALAVALEDRDLFVRERAVQALGEIGSDTALLLIERALGDDHPRIRDAATRILTERSERP